MSPRKYSKISIDGVTYIPAEERPIDRSAIDILNAIYGRLWTEAYYDPSNEETRKFAKALADKMSELNKILGFKQ